MIEASDGASVFELTGLFSWAFAFMLVLCRSGSAVMLIPGFGEMEFPSIVRAGLAFALAILITPLVAPLVPVSAERWSAGGMIAAELVAGGVLGWLARLPVLALSMTGAVISTMTGLSSVIQPDPALGAQSSAVARLFGLMGTLLILSGGLYQLPLAALVGSYRLVPPGALLPPGDLADTVVGASAAALGLAIQLSSPFLLVGLLFQAGLALLARLVPQLQVFSLAAPGQILGGFALLGFVALPLFSSWSAALAEIWARLPGL